MASGTSVAVRHSVGITYDMKWKRHNGETT